MDEDETGVDVVERAPRAWWQVPVAIGLTVALLALAVGLTVRYRHDHRDEWRHADHAWHHIEVSDDGRTLTFVGYPGADSEESDGVTFDSDPTEGGTVNATLRMKLHTISDGHAVYGDLGLGPVADTVVTLDDPVPAGTVFVDSTTPDHPFFAECPPTRQVVGEPTTDINSSDCGP